MASEKPTKILLSKTSMTIEEINTLSDTEAWKKIYSLKSRSSHNDMPEVLFTGFNADVKKILSDEAKGKFKIVKSVTKNLDFLVVGEFPGEKKIEKAQSQNVDLITEDQFIYLCETGAIVSPDEAEKIKEDELALLPKINCVITTDIDKAKVDFNFSEEYIFDIQRVDNKKMSQEEFNEVVFSFSEQIMELYTDNK